MQIADIITLRPEIQLCYVGISTKCFEILEARSDNAGSIGVHGSGGHDLGQSGASLHVNGATGAVPDATDDGNAGEDETSDDDEDDDDEDEDEDGEDSDDEGGGDGDEEGASTGPTDPDETQSENSGGDDSDDDSFVEDSVSKVRLRLREILFYDDKVAIFKARHAKL